MPDIVIARAEVISIEKVWAKPQQSPANPAGVGEAKQIIASKLQITPMKDDEGAWGMNGTISVPMQLTFGKVYELTLHDPLVTPLTEEGRLFKDEA